MPGVQYPHCRPWFSMNAFCIGCISPFVGKALDGQDVGAVGLHGQHGAALHRFAVEVQAARAARRRVAADVGAREAEGFAYVVDEQSARFHIAFVVRAVDGDVDLQV